MCRSRCHSELVSESEKDVKLATASHRERGVMLGKCPENFLDKNVCWRNY